MIRLVGGKYDGREVPRPPIPAGSTIAIIDDGHHEVYRMEKDGVTATIQEPHTRMDSGFLAKKLPQ